MLLLLDLDEFDRRREQSMGWEKSFIFLLEGRKEGMYVEARPQPAPARKIWPSVGCRC
jgi:hypothetical protein